MPEHRSGPYNQCKKGKTSCEENARCSNCKKAFRCWCGKSFRREKDLRGHRTKYHPPQSAPPFSPISDIYRSPTQGLCEEIFPSRPENPPFEDQYDSLEAGQCNGSSQRVEDAQLLISEQQYNRPDHLYLQKSEFPEPLIQFPNPMDDTYVEDTLLDILHGFRELVDLITGRDIRYTNEVEGNVLSKHEDFEPLLTVLQNKQYHNRNCSHIIELWESLYCLPIEVPLRDQAIRLRPADGEIKFRHVFYGSLNHLLVHKVFQSPQSLWKAERDAMWKTILDGLDATVQANIKQNSLLRVNKDSNVITELEIYVERLTVSFSETLYPLLPVELNQAVDDEQKRRLKSIILRCVKFSRELQARESILQCNYIWPKPGQQFDHKFHESLDSTRNGGIIAFPVMFGVSMVSGDMELVYVKAKIILR